MISRRDNRICSVFDVVEIAENNYHNFRRQLVPPCFLWFSGSKQRADSCAKLHPLPPTFHGNPASGFGDLQTRGEQKQMLRDQSCIWRRRKHHLKLCKFNVNILFFIIWINYFYYFLVEISQNLELVLVYVFSNYLGYLLFIQKRLLYVLFE